MNRVIGYYPNWAAWRQGEAKFTPKHVNPKLCTNIVYAFAVLDPTTFKVIVHEPALDVDKGHYKEVVRRCHEEGCKASLAVGGWTDSQGTKWSTMLAARGTRKAFIQSALDLIKKYGFDGLDLDLEFPTSPQWERGDPRDKEGFSALIKELRKAFYEERVPLLSAAISASPDMIDKAYDVEALNLLDWIGVMTYDFAKSGKGTTRSHSPLSSITESVEHLLKRGVKAGKIVVGIPSYGITCRLESSQEHGYGAPSCGSVPSRYLEGDKLPYFEIAENVTERGWTMEENEDMGAYAHKGRDWVSFVSPQDIAIRGQWARKKGLGGLMMWDLSQDDFRKDFPLLKAMHSSVKLSQHCEWCELL